MLVGKAVYFVRTCDKRPVNAKTCEMDISYGEIGDDGMQYFQATLTELFTPILESQGKWGRTSEEHVADFLGGLRKFGEGLGEAIASLQGGVELRKPSAENTGMVDFSRDSDGRSLQRSLNDVLSRSNVVANFEECMESWSHETDKLIADGDSNKEAGNQGPDTELEYWRSRQSRFNRLVLPFLIHLFGYIPFSAPLT